MSTETVTHRAPNDDRISKLRIGRWRLGFKTDAREGMHLRSLRYFFAAPRLSCGCWRVWIGRFFIGRKCR